MHGLTGDLWATIESPELAALAVLALSAALLGWALYPDARAHWHRLCLWTRRQRGRIRGDPVLPGDVVHLAGFAFVVERVDRRGPTALITIAGKVPNAPGSSRQQ